MSAPSVATTELGDLLRHWRDVRRLSQLDLASEAGSTPRYVSFMETGRARPSREMVLRLAGALRVPHRDRNGLLLAAGFAPAYEHSPLDGPALDRVEAAIQALLDQHDPLPAVVLDREWTVVRANVGATALFAWLFAPDPIPDPANALRLFGEPGPVRDAVTNWRDVVPGLLDRAHREAVGGVLDQATAALVVELQARPEIAAAVRRAQDRPPAGPVIDVRFEVDGVALAFFSLVTSIGTPIDVTAQELRVESFFPADTVTRDRWTALLDPSMS